VIGVPDIRLSNVIVVKRRNCFVVVVTVKRLVGVDAKS
jgi:hypothetical protein